MTTKYKVIYTPAAIDDLRDIYFYIAIDLNEPKVAKNQVDRIRSMIKKLGEFPKRHPKVDGEPWTSMGIRKVPVDKYVVYYLVREEHRLVFIVRIFYGGRDVSQLLLDNE